MSSVMNKLLCSFKSNLPNEIDFAIQVAIILANSDNFIWSKDYPLVDAICSSLHVFTCICDHDASTSSSCYCYPRFWHKILTEKYKCNSSIQAATIPPDTEQSYLNFTNLQDHDPKQQQKIYKRVKLVAELIKQFSMTCDLKAPPPQPPPPSNMGLGGLMPSSSSNLTFDNTLSDMRDENNRLINYNYHQTKKKKPKATPALLKFVSLLIHCNDTPLNLKGLDILSNIASKLAKIPENSIFASDYTTCNELVQMFQEYCFDNISCQDGDIYIIIRSIEVVSKLISSFSGKTSSSVINLINRKGLLPRVEQLLTSRNDVNLFLAALECCYKISRHQPHLIACGNAQHMIKILVNLLDCEERQFFTANALKRVKLLDYDGSTVESEPIDPSNNQGGSTAAEHDSGDSANSSAISLSVRLTAALILRNLATESPEMRQLLEYHELLLSEICMTNGRDESKIIAECLSLFSQSE